MNYSIRELLGSGGSGAVYKIWDYNLERYCAMKQIKGQCKEEAMCLNELDHIMLPKVICAEYENGNTIIIMEYIEGITMTQYLEEKGALSQEKAVRYLLSILEVLEYLHQQRPSLVFGDLKTDNIMVKPDGSLKLIDFGTMEISKEYRKRGDGKRYATRGFASPEIYDRDQEIDCRSDIYSAGAVLFFMLTGIDPSKPPFEIMKITKCNPCLSKKIEKIVEKSTHRDRDERHQTCDELKRELEGYERSDKKSQRVMLVTDFLYGCLIVYTINLIIRGMFYLEKGNYEVALSTLLKGMGVIFFAVILKKIVRLGTYSAFPVKTVKSLFLTEKDGCGILDSHYP